MVRGGYGWKLGNGRDVSIWFDIWVENEPLYLIIEDIDPIESMWNVADILHEDGSWNLDRLSTVIPLEIKEKIVHLLTHNPQLERIR